MQILAERLSFGELGATEKSGSFSMHCKCDWTNTGAKQGFSQHTAEVSTDATDMSEHDMSVA